MSDPIRDAITRAIISTGDDLLKKQNADGPFDFYEARPVLPAGKTRQQMIDELAATAGVTREVAEQAYRHGLDECRIAKSSEYQVAVYEDTPNGFGEPMVHLSIKRLDREAIRDWRVLQQIKNAIVGEEAEGIELFPAETRRVDAANQYHLFCFRPGFKVPVGFDTRLVHEHDDAITGSKQRRFESPDALLPSRDQFSNVLRQLLAQIDLGGSIPAGLLNESRAMVNQVEHARQILQPPQPTAIQRLIRTRELIKQAQQQLEPVALGESFPHDNADIRFTTKGLADIADEQLQEVRDELGKLINQLELLDKPPGIHCDCWDNGEACCHCGSTSQNGNCDGDDGNHPCKGVRS